MRTMDELKAATNETDSGCWEWLRKRDRFGYGRLGPGRLAHRAAFSLVNGPIPVGMLVCHTCDNPACCNPYHLWLGNHRDNGRDASLKRRHRGQSQTHCINGHEYTSQNTYLRPGTVASRDCRACIRERVRKYQQRGQTP